ncbi:MAG: right-handed parallel beta-helix repeat-containing protein, partial [Pseudomonadota bacterium]
GAAGSITNNASVSGSEGDPVPGNNADSEATTVVASGGFDVPLTQYLRINGFLDYAVAGGSLRADSNSVDPCSLNATSAASVSGIPGTATITAAYLYWAASGTTVDANVTLDGAGVLADRTWQSRLTLGGNNYDFFGGFEDVTSQVDAKRNGVYTFGGLSVDDSALYCNASAVLGGWALYVIYEDAGNSGKTLVLYDGFDMERNGVTSYLLSGIYASSPVEANVTSLLWEGDESLGTGTEELRFNGTPLTDALNPPNNVYNSTINTLGTSTAYGVDMDTFDVSSLVTDGDTLASTDVSVGPDLVILNAVLLQVRTNIIVGTVFEDVNYGGGQGRSLAAAQADAAAFAVRRPGATVELYASDGTLLRSTVTSANGLYGFTGLPDGDYFVRVVSSTVTSSRPGASGSEVPVQTYRTNASGATAAIVNEIGGANPAVADDGANGGAQNLSALTVQSLAPVTITAATAKTGVDFGFNFNTIVNANSAGQGSLAQFIANAGTLTNANLDQDGLVAGLETSIFMIPTNADPLGRPADPAFDAGRGVVPISVTASLPAIIDADTVIDGSTQTTNIGDTNAGLLGTGGTVGLGADGVAGTADELALPQVAAPEIEIVDGAGVAVGLDVQASDTTIRSVAIYGFGTAPASPTEANIRIDNGTNLTGTLIENAIIGTPADSFTDPGAAARSGGPNVLSRGADNSTLRNSLVGFATGSGLSARGGSSGWTVRGNEFRSNSAFGYLVGDGIAIEGAGSGSATVTGNLVIDNGAVGIETYDANGNTDIADNTFTGNGFATGAGADETSGIRLFGANNTVDRNLISGNYGAGVSVTSGASGSSISRNSIFDNGAATGQIGIDLLAPADDANTGTAPFFTVNDNNDADAGGNGLYNYPVLELAAISGGNLTLTGWARPGAAIEWFVADDDPSGFGEGRTYLVTLVEGSAGDNDATSSAYAGSINGLAQGADTTNRYRFTIPTPAGIAVGTTLTATGTDASGNTSEFGGLVTVAGPLVLQKRAFMPDGTAIPNGALIPQGLEVRYLLYINNTAETRMDVSIEDLLDPAFAYQPGTLRIDNSVANCAAAACTPAEEAAVYAAVAGTGALTDAVDGDVASFSAATVHAGDESVANAQLDAAAGRVLALVFAVKMQ